MCKVKSKSMVVMVMRLPHQGVASSFDGGTVQKGRRNPVPVQHLIDQTMKEDGNSERTQTSEPPIQKCNTLTSFAVNNNNNNQHREETQYSRIDISRCSKEHGT